MAPPAAPMAAPATAPPARPVAAPPIAAPARPPTRAPPTARSWGVVQPTAEKARAPAVARARIFFIGSIPLRGPGQAGTRRAPYSLAFAHRQLPARARGSGSRSPAALTGGAPGHQMTPSAGRAAA